MKFLINRILFSGQALDSNELIELMGELITKVDSLSRVALKDGLLNMDEPDSMHVLWVISDYIQNIRALYERVYQEI